MPTITLSANAVAVLRWCPARKYGIGELIKILVLLHGVVAPGEMHNHVEYQ